MGVCMSVLVISYLYLLCFLLFVLSFCIVRFMYIYSYLFCLYQCKDCWHRVTTQLQLVVIIIIICYASIEILMVISLEYHIIHLLIIRDFATISHCWLTGWEGVPWPAASEVFKSLNEIQVKFQLNIRSNYINKSPTWCNLCSLIYFTAESLYMFRVSQHPSSGVLKTVTAASGTGHNICPATSFQRGQVGTVPTWPRWK